MEVGAQSHMVLQPSLQNGTLYIYIYIHIYIYLSLSLPIYPSIQLSEHCIIYVFICVYILK